MVVVHRAGQINMTGPFFEGHFVITLPDFTF